MTELPSSRSESTIFFMRIPVIIDGEKDLYEKEIPNFCSNDFAADSACENSAPVNLEYTGTKTAETAISTRKKIKTAAEPFRVSFRISI